MKTIIEKIYISDTNKQGQPLLTKRGEKYSRVAIQTKETQGKWASNNIFNKLSASLHWKQGQTVDIEIEQNGEWLNWKFPEGQDITTTQMILDLLEKINEKLDKVFPDETSTDKVFPDDPEINNIINKL